MRRRPFRIRRDRQRRLSDTPNSGRTRAPSRLSLSATASTAASCNRVAASDERQAPDPADCRVLPSLECGSAAEVRRHSSRESRQTNNAWARQASTPIWAKEARPLRRRRRPVLVQGGRAGPECRRAGLPWNPGAAGVRLTRRHRACHRPGLTGRRPISQGSDTLTWPRLARRRFLIRNAPRLADGPAGMSARPKRQRALPRGIAHLRALTSVGG